ncbi:MAG TPA: TonB family protein [Myxococcaceae bacterium]
MSALVLPAPEPSTRTWLPWAFLGVSLAVHASVLGWLTVAPAPSVPQKRATELVMVEVEQSPPPPPVAPPKPEPVQVTRPPPRRMAFRRAEPLPNDTPPPEAKPSEPPPVVVGLTLRSTTTAGSFEAPVGNTLTGKTPERAVDPTSVKPVPVPLYELDSQPTVIGDVRIPYPEDARSRGIEGTVVLSVLVDETGQVRGVKVVSGPGSGLDQAAAKAVERIRFRPAIRKGKPVPAQITYRYTFLLD